MKKISIIFTGLFFALSTMPVFAQTISGTVRYQNGTPAANADVRLVFTDGATEKLTTTDSDGKFSNDTDATDIKGLRIEHNGKKYTIENVAKNLTITLSDPKSNQKTRTVSGTVSDEYGPLPEASVRPLDANGNPIPNIGQTSNENGEFNFSIPDNATKLQISYMGYKTRIVNPEENLNIKLEDDSTTLKVVKATANHNEGDPCSGEVLTENHPHAVGEKGQWKKINNEWVCVPTECELKYELKNNKCEEIRCNETEGYEFNGNSNQCEKTECSESEKQAVIDANGLNPQWNGKQCLPKACATNYYLNNKNKCVHDKCTKPEDDWDESQQKCVQVRCSDEQISTANATNKSEWVNGKCEFACDTAKGYTLNTTKNECEQTLCSEKDAKRMIKNNVSKNGYKLEDGVCIAIKCISDDYEITRDKTACKNKKCPTPEEDVVNGQCTKKRCTVDDLNGIHADDGYWDVSKQTCIATKCNDKLYKLKDGKCEKIDNRSDEQRQKDLEEKQKAYEDAKAKEQSTANKTLTALTTAATGIGGMQLAQGLAEQSADKDAAADMAAYIETMRCTYGEDKQVKAGPTEIELPGANDQELMNLRGQYLALAQDLKERKNALGMKPGIESETILDRATSGLYDEENIGIINGNYASLYRAQMLQSEADQKKIDDAASTSKKRVTGGAIAAGAGVVVGVVGNSLINGKLGELIKKKKDTKALEEAAKVETDALDKLKKCLQEAGVKETDKLTFSSFPPSALSVDNINCKKDLRQAKGKPAQNLFADTVDADRVLNKLIDSFGAVVAGKMIGVTLSNNPTNDEKGRAKATLTEAFDATNRRINEAKDEEGTNSSGTGALAKALDSSGVGNTVSSLLGNNDQSTDSSDADSKKKSESEIKECIEEINKKTDPILNDPNYIDVFNFDNSKRHLMPREEAAEKLSERFRTDSYKNVEPKDAPEACDVLKNLNKFIKEHDWTNDEVAITVEYITRK